MKQAAEREGGRGVGRIEEEIWGPLMLALSNRDMDSLSRALFCEGLLEHHPPCDKHHNISVSFGSPT